MTTGFHARIVATIACAVVATHAVAARPPAREAAVDAAFAEILPDAPGAAVGIYERGRLVLSKAYGLANLDHALPVTPQTVFNLASVSKQFTAFSIALLAREGKIDLQADVRTYLPELPQLGQRVTVGHLIHHLSGVRDYIALGALSGHDDESLIRQAHAFNIVKRQRSLTFPPGTRYEYSNTGYMLLAQIVRSVSGKSLRDFMQERIFLPLGMTHTRLRDDLNRIEPGYALGYEKDETGTGWQRAVYNREIAGPGNVLSTIGDLAKWMRNLAAPSVGDRALIEQLTAPASLHDGKPVRYGFGLFSGVMHGHRTISHSGGISGFRTIMVFFPDSDFGVVILANRPLEPLAAAERVARAYLPPGPHPDIVDEPGKDEPPRPESPAPSAQTLAALAGNYRSEEIDTTYTVGVESGKLTLRALYLVEPQVLTPVAEDRFDVRTGELEGLGVAIERNDAGEPAALLFDYGWVRGLRLSRDTAK